MKAVPCHTYTLRKPLSLLLAVSLLLSFLLTPTLASEDASPTLSLDHDVLSLSESKESFLATLTMDVPSDSSGWTQTQWTDWAANLEWYLTRDASDSPYESEVFPYVYTGDALENWQSWGTDGTDGTNYFTLSEPKVTVSNGKVHVAQAFTTGTFQVTEDGENYFYAFGSYRIPTSMLGTYQLSVQADGKALAETPLEVKAYVSHTPYSEIYEELLSIKALAEKNGRYFEVRSYGTSEGGHDQYCVILSDDASSVSEFKAINAIAETDPASLQAKIKNGKLDGKDYRVPFFINNVHPNEDPAVDSHLNLLRELATADTLTYYTLAGLKSGASVDMSLFDPKVAAIDGFTGLGSRKISGSATNGNNDGKTDASAYYKMSGALTVDVDELLDNLIIIDSITENPDGRSYNTRRNANGFDLNRDATNQTQAETRNLTRVISEWNPVVFTELHGFMNEFLVEPCTPPHEPNLEYDLLVENFLRGAEAFGKAALATMSVENKFDMKFQSYYTPLRDDYDPKTMTWSAWDDLCTNYGPSYAMLNCGAMGYTIETPTNNEACARLLECGMYGLLDYVMQYKDSIYNNQLEFFQRGIENVDARAQMDNWYVDVSNKELVADTWRVPYQGNDNYFPEYYVLPVDATLQRDPADAWAMGEFLNRNGVEVRQLTADVTLGGTTYKAGSLVVDMYQAKRNYANCVLWEGANASHSGFPDLYSESVSNFPEMRGFDCIPVDIKGAFEGKLSDVVTDFAGESQLQGTGPVVILSNNGNETVRAVNSLLDDGTPVGMVTEGTYKGDFVISSSAYDSLKDQYVLSATAVTEMPTAYQIERPSVYLTGRYDYGYGTAVTEGYYAQWFSKGSGFRDYENVQNNGTSSYDVMAYDKQLGFHIVSDPAQADVIVGSVALNAGTHGDAAVAAVKAGTPYISSGSEPLSYIKEALLPDLAYEKLGMEALHTVTYPTASLSTASQAADKDYHIYTYSCGVITSLPAGADVLIRAAEKDAFIAGCCLNESGTPIDGYVEAFSLAKNGMDLTVFANSVVNRAHQQDDYLFVTNTIYSKCLADRAMTLSDLNGVSFADVPANHWAADSIRYVTSNGLFTGTSANTFGPGVFMDRAMLVTVLHRMAGEPDAAASTLADVPADTWYTDAVGWAVEQKITSGTGSGFSPATPVTREQIALFLYNYAKAAGQDVSVKDGAIASYADANAVHSWASEAMNWAVSTGLISGKSGNQLDPTGTASRAEVATILMRFQSK